MPKSQQFCIGRDRRSNSWIRTTCLYKNVCYTKRQGFLFFQNGTQPEEIKVASSPSSAFWSIPAIPLEWEVVANDTVFDMMDIVWHEDVHQPRRVDGP